MKCKLCDREAIYQVKGKTYNRKNGLCPSHHRKFYRTVVAKNFTPYMDKQSKEYVPFKHDQT